MKAEQLRKSILQLAIQGKLVPQNPNDEPASVLLERIRAEKQRLIKEKKIKKDKNDSVIFKGDDNRHYEKVGSEVKDITDDLPFEIPDNWVWTRLEKAVIINPRNNLPDDIEVSFVEMKAISDGYTNQFIATNRLWKEVKRGFTHFQEGDVGFAKITPCFQNRKSVVFTNLRNGYGAGTTELHVLRPIQKTIVPNYLLHFVKSSYFIEHGKQRFSGTAGQQRFGTDEVKKTLFPLPPLSEQARIVAEIEKFEPLIAEYDKLEQQATKLDEKIYDKLKKSILQYAIQGKLVPQDPNDEPASILLERIRAEKKANLGKKFVDSYIYKGDDNCYYEKVGTNEPVRIDDLPFDIPDSWCWARLGNVVNINPKNNIDDDLDVSFVEMKSIMDGFNNMFYSEKRKWGDVRRGFTHFKDGDVGFAKITPCFQNRKSVVFHCLVNGYGAGTTELHIIRSYSDTIMSEYLLYFVKSPYFIEHGKINFSGTAGQQRFGTDEVKHTFIPIPPYNEQIHICKWIKTVLGKIKKEN